jgi:hypothetical protein
MEDIESLKDYRIADEILRIQSLSREKLEEELIEMKSREIESLNDLVSIKEYGNKYKN